MSWFTTNFIATFLMPPLSLLLALALGIFLLYRRRRFAKPLLLASFSLLWIASTPYFAEGALHLLEARTTALGNQRQAADVIVILGGGIYFHAPEYAGQDTVNEETLLRLRYGAKLQRETGKPVLVTGGKPLGNSISEAQQMRASLEQDFRVPVRWIEDASDNTFENARYSFQTLQKAGIKKSISSPMPGTCRAPPMYSAAPDSRWSRRRLLSPRVTGLACWHFCRVQNHCATARFSCMKLSDCSGIG